VGRTELARTGGQYAERISSAEAPAAHAIYAVVWLLKYGLLVYL
jgi:hypothetical protein